LVPSFGFLGLLVCCFLLVLRVQVSLTSSQYSLLALCLQDTLS